MHVRNFHQSNDGNSEFQNLRCRTLPVTEPHAEAKERCFAVRCIGKATEKYEY